MHKKAKATQASVEATKSASKAVKAIAEAKQKRVEAMLEMVETRERGHREVNKKLADVDRLVVEAFRSSSEFTKQKTGFFEEAFFLGKDLL